MWHLLNFQAQTFSNNFNIKSQIIITILIIKKILIAIRIFSIDSKI